MPAKNAVTPAPKKNLYWVDLIFLLVAVGATLFSVVSLIQGGVLSTSLAVDAQLSWHLSRAAGLTAYTLMAASTIWGLFLSSHLLKNWTPGPVSLLLHATVSWLAVGISVVHIGVLLFDGYYKYTLADLLVPFIGPYRPLAVGLGVLAIWLTVAITLSFSFRRLIGQRAWRWLHYTSYAAFALVTIHSLLAGTDVTKPGMGILVGGSFVAVSGLLSWRILQAVSAPKSAARRRTNL